MAAVVVAVVGANPNLQRQRHPRRNLPRVTTFVQMGMSVQVMIMIAITLAEAVAIRAVRMHRMPLKKSLWLQAFSREHLKCVPTQGLHLATPARQMEEEDIIIVRVASLMDTLEALARQMEEGITIVREASLMVTLAAVVTVPGTILPTFTGQPRLQKPSLQKCFDRMVTSVLSTVMMVTSV